MGETARTFFRKSYIQNVIRPCTFNFYSEDTNVSILVNNIRKDKRGTRPCDLYLALFYPRNVEELSHLRELAENCSNAGNAEDTDLRDVIYVVLNTIWEDKNYERFVEYMALAEAATTYSHFEEARTHKENALSIINEWMTRAKRGNAIIYINGRELQISINDLANKLNSEIGPSIFPKGADSLESLRNAAATFWRPQVSRDIIRRFLSVNNKEELLNINGAARPVYYLIQEVLDENLNWKTDSAQEHPLRAVYDSVNSSIEDSIQQGKTEFDLVERFDIFRKPLSALMLTMPQERCWPSLCVHG
ncbi:MAG: hypothetical protein LUD50_08125 [Clostridia bacterium]|nr:hypothetical protein [Clostridia bacterium]